MKQMANISQVKMVYAEVLCEGIKESERVLHFYERRGTLFQATHFQKKHHCSVTMSSSLSQREQLRCHILQASSDCKKYHGCKSMQKWVAENLQTSRQL